jgi:flagellar basal body-associated protein FliL
MESIHTTAHPPRRGRWLIGLVLLGLFLVAYAIALSWFTQKVQVGVQQSLNALPVAADAQNPAR